MSFWLSTKFRAALILVLLGASPLAHAGPPFVTDDPEPAELHTWEVNYAVNGTHGRGSTTASLPGADINYGAATGLQLHVQAQMAYSSGNGAMAHHGLGDTELGVKYRLTAESDDASDWMVSLYPLLELPTGNASLNLGAGKSSLYLPVWFQTTRAGWTFYGGGGYWINPGSGQRNAWAGGAVALYQLTGSLQLGAELFGKTATQVLGSSSNGFNVGGNWNLAKNLSLLFSTGRGLGHAQTDNRFSAYLGLQVITSAGD